jgi:hypothetical protein
MVTIGCVEGPIFEAPSDDPDFEFVLIDETICLRPAKTLTGRDLRNSVIEQTIKQLENKFRDGDPVRDSDRSYSSHGCDEFCCYGANRRAGPHNHQVSQRRRPGARLR